MNGVTANTRRALGYTQTSGYTLTEDVAHCFCTSVVPFLHENCAENQTSRGNSSGDSRLRRVCGLPQASRARRPVSEPGPWSSLTSDAAMSEAREARSSVAHAQGSSSRDANIGPGTSRRLLCPRFSLSTCNLARVLAHKVSKLSRRVCFVPCCGSRGPPLVSAPVAKDSLLRTPRTRARRVRKGRRLYSSELRDV